MPILGRRRIRRVFNSCRREAELYYLAAMFYMEGLQQIAVGKMKLLIPMIFKPFISVSEHFYNNCGFDGLFWSHCRQQIEISLPKLGMGQWLREQMAERGVLAAELSPKKLTIQGTCSLAYSGL